MTSPEQVLRDQGLCGKETQPGYACILVLDHEGPCGTPSGQEDRERCPKCGAKPGICLAGGMLPAPDCPRLHRSEQVPEPEVERFEGHPGRECGEHRTLGARAWCYGCSTYCYPGGPCPGCELPQLRERLADARGELDQLRPLLRIHKGTSERLAADLETAEEAELQLRERIAELEAERAEEREQAQEWISDAEKEVDRVEAALSQLQEQIGEVEGQLRKQAATTERLAECPDAEVCKTCPCRADDDVCFPGERLRADLKRAEARLAEVAEVEAELRMRGSGKFAVEFALVIAERLAALRPSPETKEEE